MDRSSRPVTYPHQMAPEVEARIVEPRRAHPGWGPRTLRYELDYGKVRRPGCVSPIAF